MVRHFLLCVLILFAPLVGAADAAVRPNSLIFNHTYPLVSGGEFETPIYLTRRGEYFAQAILERADGSQRPASIAFDLNIQIDRDDKVLFERDFSTELGRDRPVATLFFLTSDREIPIKTPLTLALRINAVDVTNNGETLRIQVTRKFNRSRIY